MPLYIKDQAIADLVTELARRQGTTKQAAVKAAIETALEQTQSETPLRETFAALRRTHPLPPRTGKNADKAFFDDLSGEL
jgi:antitoxin VapB